MFKQLDLFTSFQNAEAPAIETEQIKTDFVADAALVRDQTNTVLEEEIPTLQRQEHIAAETEIPGNGRDGKVTEEETADEQLIEEETTEEQLVEEETAEEQLVEEETVEALTIISAVSQVYIEPQKKSVAPLPVNQKPGKRGRKSLKDMSDEFELIAIPEDEVLFKKQYYSIGEVSAMFHLNTSLLRYWETEFDILKPRKNRKGDRHFRPEDIKNLYLIHHLLRQRKYTIEGAKEYLKKNKSKAQQNFELIQRLEKLKGFLLELKAGL